MRIKRVSSSLFLGFLIALSGNAQQKTELKQIQATSPVSIHKPLLLDSIDSKGVKFEESLLLENYVTIPAPDQFSTTIQRISDEVNLFVLPNTKKEKDDLDLQLVRFQIGGTSYCKKEIKITTPGLFELFIDGKKELTKSTLDNSFEKAKEKTQSIQLMPGWTKEITLKLITKGNESQDSIQIEIDNPAKKENIHVIADNNSKRLTTILDVMTGNKVTNSTVSPNGDYTMVTYRTTAKGGKTEFYTELIDNKTNKIKHIGAIFPSWMPKSNAYYQTVTKGDRRELIITDPATGHTEVIASDIPNGSFRFLPNESALLFTEKVEGVKRSGDLKALGSPNDRIGGYYDRHYIHLYDLATGVKTRLTYGKNTTSIQDISPDSRYVLFRESREVITERPFSSSNLYCVDLQTLEMDTLWTNEPFAYSAKFSPSGKELLITGAPEAFNGIGLNIKSGQIANSYDIQAYIMNLKNLEIDPITKSFDPSINSATWNSNDYLIYLTTVDKDCQNTYTYDTKKKRFTKLDLEEEVINSFNLSANSLLATYTGSSLLNSNKAYTYDIKRGKSTLISDPTKERFDNLQLGEVEPWNFIASDGTTIEGRYYLPPNFDANQKYPMIVYYYSGTTPTNRAFEHPYSMHVYAAMGYVVYTLQPSGTIGFGQEFSARHVNAWGIRTAEDIIEGTKGFINEHSFVNKDKIGCMGASYGGFMTMYLQTQTDLFAAAVSHAGISSLSSYWGEGYWGFTYSSGASAHSYPWNNKELYVEQSPLFNADKINTPILLLHGTVDTNVPIGESIQMYTALKVLGKPVEFIQVKDENHGIAKYDRRLKWNYSIYSWFEKWLKDDNEWWNTLYPHRKYEE